MVIEHIRELNHAVPFRPYVIKLASGATHQVPHPDFVLVAPRGSWVMLTDADDHPHWISSLLIEEVTQRPSKSRKK